MGTYDPETAPEPAEWLELDEDKRIRLKKRTAQVKRVQGSAERGGSLSAVGRDLEK
jgi:hypothetical protein